MKIEMYVKFFYKKIWLFHLKTINLYDNIKFDAIHHGLIRIILTYVY